MYTVRQMTRKAKTSCFYFVVLRLPHFLFLAHAFQFLMTVMVERLVLLLCALGITVRNSSGRPPVLAVFAGFLSRFRKISCVSFLAHDLRIVI
jgi:hypothetical protein